MFYGTDKDNKTIKLRVNMYESLADLREGYLTDQFIVICSNALTETEVKKICIQRRNENENENKDIEDYLWSVESFFDEDIEVIDLRKAQTNE